MLSKDFQIIINNMDGLIASAQRIKEKVESVNSLEDLSVKELKALVVDARGVCGSQDRIFQIELYHVIGMSDMSATQSAKFIKKVKEFGTYRSVLKRVSSYQYEAIPDIPGELTVSKFNCGQLGVKFSAIFE